MKTLRPREIFGSFIRWVYFSHACYNYQRMQGISFAQSMAYALKRLYPDKTQLGGELARHTAFFNTEPNLGCVIHGLVLNMEERRAKGEDISAQAIADIKTGLKGALAGLGDPLTQGIIVPVLLALGMFVSKLYPASIAGPAVYFVVVNGVFLAIAWRSWKAGYASGQEAVTRLLGRQQRISRMAGILGLLVLGAIVPQFAGITLLDGLFGAPVQSGAGSALSGSTVGVNGMAGGALGLATRALPGLLALAAVLAFHLLLKRGISSRRLVFAAFIAGFVLNLLGLGGQPFLTQFGEGNEAERAIMETLARSANLPGITLPQALGCAGVYYLSNSTWFTDIGFVTINRPFITGTLVGLILGDLQAGIEMGIMLNLMYFGFISAGGAIPSDVGLAGTSGAAIGILLKPYLNLTGNYAAYCGLATGVLLGMLGRLLWDRRMQWNSAFATRAAACAEAGNLRGLFCWNVLAPQAVLLLVSFLPFALVALLLGGSVGLFWMARLLANILGPVAVTAQLLPCLGLAINLRSLSERQPLRYFFAGFCISLIASLF